jgi:hypothetical protein
VILCISPGPSCPAAPRTGKPAPSAVSLLAAQRLRRRRTRNYILVILGLRFWGGKGPDLGICREDLGGCRQEDVAAPSTSARMSLMSRPADTGLVMAIRAPAWRASHMS